MMPLKSIRARMTVSFALSIAVLMLLVCSGLIWYSKTSAERNADQVLAGAVGRVQTELAEKRENRDLGRLVNEELEDLRPENLAVVLIDGSGRIIQSSPNVGNSRALVRSDGWRTTRFRVGPETIVIGTPWKGIEAELRRQSVILTLLGAFVIILAAAGAWVLVGRTLSPISSLSQQATSASVDSLNIRLTEPSEDAEIVGLVATLNGLLKRLSETAMAKGRFYSAASHELRTPLQALSGHLELALTKDRAKEDYRACVEEAHKQTRRLVSLVRDLLLLYQLDSASSPLPAEPDDLTSVCARNLSQFQSVISERGLQVRTDLLDDAPVVAPPTHVDILVRNLVENAVRYADERSEVVVNLAAEDGSFRLTVVNKCSQGSWEANRLFEPFTRFDPSRNSLTGGTGLGLAICKAVAASNHWSVDLQKDGLLVTATVTLPIATPSA